jgi:hypothetical protein
MAMLLMRSNTLADCSLRAVGSINYRQIEIRISVCVRLAGVMQLECRNSSQVEFAAGGHEAIANYRLKPVSLRFCAAHRIA